VAAISSDQTLAINCYVMQGSETSQQQCSAAFHVLEHHWVLLVLQDTDYAVRICMCWQLPPLARALGRAAAAEELLPEALEVRALHGRVCCYWNVHK